MGLFLIPLLLGFVINGASAFTTAFSRRWGEQRGSAVTLILRVGLGMPLWIVGLALAMRAPAPALAATGGIADVLAWSLILAGSGVMTAALFSLRMRAALPSTHDQLAETGLYAHVRHPLYSGMLFVFMGLALYRPTLPAGLACFLGLLWIHVQARLEEYDLTQRLPGYADYMRRVPRFWPGAGLPKS